MPDCCSVVTYPVGSETANQFDWLHTVLLKQSYKFTASYAVQHRSNKLRYDMKFALCKVHNKNTNYIVYMNRYQCARAQCYEHHFYWLASWPRLQQQSHYKMIIPDFWHCQNFIAGYLWLQHCDSSHRWISQSQSNVVQPFYSHHHVSLMMLIFCLGQSKITQWCSFPEWCIVWFWHPVTHSGWVQTDSTSFSSLCVPAYFRMLLGNIRCFIWPSVSCIKFQVVFSFNLWW